MACKVYVGTSLDGYIATADGGLDWLDELPEVTDHDMGWSAFIGSVDALVMGNGTFEKVLTFDAWPYELPVIVMSGTRKSIPASHVEHAELFDGSPAALVEALEGRGLKDLYIDGGRLITSFISEGLVSEMIITVLPVVLGGGIPLFGQLPEAVWFEYVGSVGFENGMAQHTYRAKVAG